MALGTMTITPKVKEGPIRADILSFPGDGAYPVGGTVGFEATYRTALAEAGYGSPGRELLALIQIDVSGYVLRYDDVNDKLMVFEGNYDGADGVLQQSSTANLAGITFRVVALSI